MVEQKLLLRQGVAIASGVPALVFVSVGSVASLTGKFSPFVWLVSSVTGFVMAVLFARVNSAFPNQDGGIAAATARVFERKSLPLASLVQWAYWLGWAPSPAIYGVVAGTYVRAVVFPESSPFISLVIGVIFMGSILFVNCFGVCISSRIQGSICALLGVSVFIAVALSHPASNIGAIEHVQSISSVSSTAFLGALFLAGWSAYGAEIALTYQTDYRAGCCAARQALYLIGIVSIVVYAAIPLVLLAAIGSQRLSGDPAEALEYLFPGSERRLGEVVALFIMLSSMILTVNMTVLASSRLLGQMSKSGYTRIRLDQENRFGRPWRALIFDGCANVVLLLITSLTSKFGTEAIPVTLLATANTGYFISLIAGLLASMLHKTSKLPTRITGCGLCCFNIALLASAGLVWGWPNVAVGVLSIAFVSVVMFPRKRALIPRWQPTSVNSEVRTRT